LGAVQMFVLGMIGEYLGRLYIESKRRPLYLVADVTGPVLGHASLGYRFEDSGEVSVSPVTPREYADAPRQDLGEASTISDSPGGKGKRPSK
jgi:hypothetical protein